MKSGHAHPNQILLLASCHPEVKPLYSPAPSVAGKFLQSQPLTSLISCRRPVPPLAAPASPCSELRWVLAHALSIRLEVNTCSRHSIGGTFSWGPHRQPQHLLCQQNRLVTPLFAPLTMRSADAETASEPRFRPKCVNSVRRSVEPTSEPKNRPVVKKGR